MNVNNVTCTDVLPVLHLIVTVLCVLLTDMIMLQLVHVKMVIMKTQPLSLVLFAQLNVQLVLMILQPNYHTV